MNNLHYYNHTKVVKKVWYGIKGRPRHQWTRLESLETDLLLYGQVSKVIQWKGE